jgi:hypothetical protein
MEWGGPEIGAGLTDLSERPATPVVHDLEYAQMAAYYLKDFEAPATIGAHYKQKLVQQRALYKQQLSELDSLVKTQIRLAVDVAVVVEGERVYNPIGPEFAPVSTQKAPELEALPPPQIPAGDPKCIIAPSK